MDAGQEGNKEVEIVLDELNHILAGQASLPRGVESGEPNEPYLSFLRLRVQAMQLEKAGLRHAVEARERELAQVIESYRELERRYILQTQELVGAREDHCVLEGELARAVMNYQELNREYQCLVQEKRAVDQTLRDICASRSWRFCHQLLRIVAPVRNFVHRVRVLARGR
jgi:hypothetical protein